MEEKPLFRNVIRSKNAIKNAVVELISEKPVARIKVKEVIDLAGISKGTFYAHYTSIHDVLNEIENESISYLREFLKNQKIEEVIIDFYPFLSAMFAQMSANLDFFEKLFLSSYFDQMFRNMQQIIIEYISENQKNYSKINMTDDSKMFLTYALTGAIQVVRGWYMKEYIITPDELASKINSFVLKGIKSVIEDKNTITGKET